MLDITPVEGLIISGFILIAYLVGVALALAIYHWQNQDLISELDRAVGHVHDLHDENQFLVMENEMLSAALLLVTGATATVDIPQQVLHIAGDETGFTSEFGPIQTGLIDLGLDPVSDDWPRECSE